MFLVLNYGRIKAKTLRLIQIMNFQLNMRARFHAPASTLIQETLHMADNISRNNKLLKRFMRILFVLTKDRYFGDGVGQSVDDMPTE